MKIIFMGTPEFAVPALQALIDSEHEIVAVYTAPPKPAGRGKQLRKSAVHMLAENAGLKVRTPKSLKEEALPKCDFAVVAAYGILLPAHILAAPKHGCLNIHPSDLPRWRGAAPLQRAIMAGDEKTAICIMQMDEGLDTGDVLFRAELQLPPKITTGELHDQTALMGAIMTLEVINNFDAFPAQQQTEEGLTYAKKITREEERIDWAQAATEIDRQIRGLNPFPGAYFMYDGEKYKVFAADILDEKGAAGEVLDDQLTIVCGQGALQIKVLQKQGKKPMPAADFLRGSKIAKGENLNQE